MPSTSKENGERSVPFTEVVIAAMNKGAGAAVRLNPSKRTMNKALKDLRDRGRDDLAKSIEHLLPTPNGKGRKLADLGESRDYAVQAQAGVDFVRVPTAVIGATREGGSFCTVTPVDAGTSRTQLQKLLGGGRAIILTSRNG